MDLKSYLNEKRKLVESHLYKSVGDDTIPKTLRDAMAYSLEAGGKRLRPILVIAGAEAVGCSAGQVMNIAVALEMIHTFSLIHDDLPAMDDDSLRRGKPTNHKVFGEAVAILAGDGLLAQAFSVLAGTLAAEPALLIEVIRDIADATGGKGMTGGQVIDIESTGKKITESELTKLHSYKTGALIRVCAVSGAKLCGASKSQIEALSRYGEVIGLAFQIADDILDIEGDQATIGKDIGSDVEKGKNTYPSIVGIEASRKKAKDLIQEATDLVSMFGDKGTSLSAIAQYIIDRQK